MENIMSLCKKCGNKAPASSMKLDLDEKKMICPECIKNKKLHKEIKEEVFKKDDAKKILPALSPKEDEKPVKAGHKCASCGYKFMINTETGKPKNCPYCNARVMGI